MRRRFQRLLLPLVFAGVLVLLTGVGWNLIIRSPVDQECETHHREKIPIIQPFEQASRIYSDNYSIDDLYKLYDSISQPEVALMMAWVRYKGSSGHERAEALMEIKEIMSDRARVDNQVRMIGVLLFGSEHAHSILYEDRGPSDDFECFKSTLNLFEKHCGRMSVYGWKHNLAFENICNKHVGREIFEQACIDTCGENNFTVTQWSNLDFLGTK